MEGTTIFTSHTPATTASPSPQTGEVMSTGEPPCKQDSSSLCSDLRSPLSGLSYLSDVPSLLDEDRVMPSSKMDHMVTMESYKYDPVGSLPSPISIDCSLPWQGSSGTMSSQTSMREEGGGIAPLPKSRWQGGAEASLHIEMDSSLPKDQRSITMQNKPPHYVKPIIRYISTPTRVFKTDVSSFRSLVQQLTGQSCSSPLIPRSNTFKDVISNQKDDSSGTHISTYDRKESAMVFSPVHNSDIMGDHWKIIQKEIIGRVEEHKHETIIERVDDKHDGIVGRVIDKLAVMKLIMSHDPSNIRFTIVCIIGADGLGKTSLTSLVYKDSTICRSFDARAWLCLSDVCDYEEFLGSVMASLMGVSCRLNERDELEEVLKEELMGKKFLIVLDNLCENNVQVCRNLLPLLNVGDKGSAVIVTTNSNTVAGHLGTTHAYNLKGFMHPQFFIKAKPNIIEYSPYGIVIGNVISECSSFPMFSKVIRGIQQCLDDTIKSKLIEVLSRSDNHLQQLLHLSYSYLRPNHKRCFLYCSMFPRDYIYEKEKLLRLWMSQGFIMQEKEKQGNEDCKDAFDELLHRSFFDYCPSSECKEQKYVMHGLSSQLAWSASGNKFFRARNHELHCIPKDVHHLSIIPKQCDLEIYFDSFTELRDLSTFLLVHNSQLESNDTQFHVMDPKALDECFRNFRCLKTLDLSYTDIRELPISIGHVSSLCFLGLNNTNLRRLPNSICNLFNLQTLELQNSAFLVELPNDIKNLNSLYHLDSFKENGPIYVPPGIGQLTNLQTLTAFTVGGVSWNCEISELARLNSLKGCLHIQSLNNVENAEDAKCACLATKKLQKLSLEWCYSGEDVETSDKMLVAEEVLDALKPHSLLGELNIKGYYGLEFPSWIANYSLSDLVSITLDNCYNCQKLPPLGALPVLRCLFIQNLRGVQLITSEFYAIDTTTHKSFPNLEILKLRDMYSLQYWHDVLDGDFPSLRNLSIERCPKLNSIPGFQFVSDVSVMTCSKLNLPALRSLQTLKVGSLKQAKCFALPCELRSLVMLEVISCEHLCSLNGLSSLQSLKHLKFRTCPRLNFVQDEPLPGTLQTVDIHSNCYALSNWRPNGFEELPDASEVYRKFIRHERKDKGADSEAMHEP